MIENNDNVQKEQTELLNDHCEIVPSVQVDTVEDNEVNQTKENTSVDNAVTRYTITEVDVVLSRLLNNEDNLSINVSFMNEDIVQVDQNIEEDFAQQIGTNSLLNVRLFCSILFQKKTFLIAGIFGFADVFTDLLLVYQYYLEEQYLFCALTASFIWIPSLMTTITLYKICVDEQKDSWLYKLFVKCKWPLLFLFTFQMSSIIFALKHGLEFKRLSKEEFEEKQKLLLQLQLVDAFNEAAPQATLQWYILSRMYGSDIKSIHNGGWQIVSMIFSWFTIARVATSHSFNFDSTSDEINIRKQLVPIAVDKYFINIAIILMRLPLLSWTFIASPTSATCCIVIHYILCYIGLGYLKIKLPNRQLPLTRWFTFPGVSLFNVLIDIDMSIFRILIVSKLRVYMLFYTLFILEYVIFTIICAYNTNVIGSIMIGTIGLFVSICYMYAIYKTQIHRDDIT